MRTALGFVVLSVVAAGAWETPTSDQEYLENIKRGLDEYQKTRVRPPYLDQVLSHFDLHHLLRGHFKQSLVNAFKDEVMCNLCDIAVGFIMEERKLGLADAQVKAEALELCRIFHIETDRVCEGLLDLNADIFFYIFDHNPDLKAGRMCDIILQEYACNFTNIDWTVDVPEGRSPDRPHQVDDPSPTYKILHVTDVHMDPLYTPGKAKSCEEPLCCQNDQTDDDDGTEGETCGYWAEYGNDVSENLIDEVIRFAGTLDIDFVYFTGDIVSHRIWTTTRQSNAHVIEKFLMKLKNGFTVPVFPTLGNHEATPLNQFVNDDEVPANLSTRWLYDLIEKEWAQWLPDSAMDTIAKGGFYTISPVDGFRIVVLNSNVGYRDCWWLMHHIEDPYEHLDWLVSILSQAEAKNESVHILGHLPTGHLDTFKIWGREYNKIVNRFANTITGQFNGHVHVDTFQLYYNTSNPAEAVNVAWNGASLVPYDQANPSFKVYHVDKKTFGVIDIDQWTFNLTEANENPAQYPEWYKIYSFRDAFGLNTLEPGDMAELLVQMAINHTLLEQYHLYRYKNSDFALNDECKAECQKGYLCEFSTAVYGNLDQCNELKEIYDDHV